MIKIKTNITLKNIRGVEFKAEDGKPILMSDVICNTLASSVTRHAECFKLAKKFATDKEVELKADDVLLIKQIITDPRFELSSVTVGQILEVIGE